MTLEQEILERSQEISTDAYAMSVGELISLYKDGELDIHPEFQRFFRWTPEQKSKFIESILLGIPIPSLFVSQTADGTWEVVDGLQRISTLLELVGELKDPEGNEVPPLRLLRTRYLPGLEGRVWSENGSDSDGELPTSARLKIKRARLDLKIVLNTSDPKAKYELFQRLNTGGSLATDQEVRSCILIMVNREFFNWLCSLAENEDFRTCIPLSERSVEEQYNLELLVRFLVFRKAQTTGLGDIPELGSFLTERIVELAEDDSYDYKKEEEAFTRTFGLLAAALGEDAFKKYDTKKQRALGPLLISVFEVMALGISFHVDHPGYEIEPETVRHVHQSLWDRTDFRSSTGTGVRASRRIPATLTIGRRAFGLEDS